MGNGSGRIDIGIHRTNRADSHFERRLDLGAKRALGVEFRRRDHRLHHFADVSTGCEKCLRHAVNQRLRRLVGDEAHGKFSGNEARRGRVLRENVQHLLGIVLAAASRDGHAQDRLGALVVNTVVIEEVAALAGCANGPTGEAARDFDNVLLRVTAIHAERVEFQQFTSVIFVEAAFALGSWFDGCVGGDGFPIVQIKKHRGRFGGSLQQLTKSAENVRPNGISFVGRDQGSIRSFVDEDVEVVVPEVVHQFSQLPVRINRPHQLRFVQVEGNHLLGRGKEHDFAACLRRCNRNQAAPHVDGHGKQKPIGSLLVQGLQQCPLVLKLAAAQGSDLIGFENLQQRLADRVLVGFGLNLRLLALLGLLDLIAFQLQFDSGARERVGRKGRAAIVHRFDDLRRRIMVDQCRIVHLKRRERCQLFVENGVFGDAFRMKLVVDPTVKAEQADAFQIAGPGSE